MKKSILRVCAVALVAALVAITGGGCQLSLDDEDERETVEAEKGGIPSSSYEFSDSSATELSKAVWTLSKTVSKYGVFLCLDSTDGATTYNMTVDSIEVDGIEQLSSAVNLTTDAYINNYTDALKSSDTGVKACAKEISVSNYRTIVYTISDITVTGQTPEGWGLYNFGFTDTTNSIKYACRSDGWNNESAGCSTYATAVTGTWASGNYTDGENVLLSAPYTAEKIKLVLKVDNSAQQATLTVYTVGTASSDTADDSSDEATDDTSITNLITGSGTKSSPYVLVSSVAETIQEKDGAIDAYKYQSTTTLDTNASVIWENPIASTDVSSTGWTVQMDLYNKSATTVNGFDALLTFFGTGDEKGGIYEGGGIHWNDWAGNWTDDVTSLTTDSWITVTFVFGADGTLTRYIGTTAYTETATGTATTLATNMAKAKYVAVGVGGIWDAGYVDEGAAVANIKIYKTALTAEQISTLLEE